MAIIIQESISSKSHISNTYNYILNDKKTNDYLIGSLNCNINTALKEFDLTKTIFNKRDGIIAHHMIQSFAPGEVDPKTAHQIGMRLAQNVLPNFQVIVSTHIDKEHIHNHIMVNSVSFENGKKYYGNLSSLNHAREQSDKLCVEYNLSTLKQRHNTRSLDRATNHLAAEGKSWKVKLINAIDEALEFTSSKEDFIKYMESYGYEVKYQNVNISFKDPFHQKFIRAKTLAKEFGEQYSKEGIENRINEIRGIQGKEQNRSHENARTDTEAAREFRGNGIFNSKESGVHNTGIKKHQNEFERYEYDNSYNKAVSKAITLNRVFDDRKKHDDTLEQELRIMLLLVRLATKKKKDIKKPVNNLGGKNYKLVSVKQVIKNPILGNTSYEQIKNMPGSTVYIKMDAAEYEKFKGSNIEFAAFRKDDKYNIAIKEPDQEKVLNIINRKYEKQLGNVMYSKMLESEGKTVYRVVSKEMLAELQKSNLKFAGFEKEKGKHNIAFKEKDIDIYNSIMGRMKYKVINKYRN